MKEYEELAEVYKFCTVHSRRCPNQISIANSCEFRFIYHFDRELKCASVAYEEFSIEIHVR